MKQLSLIALICATLLSACATLSRNECVTADWQTIGLEDGSKGYPVNRIGDHRKACAEHGVTPDLESYQTGHANGLRLYCVPRNGYQVGKRGGSDAGLCPTDLQGAFSAALSSGQEIYQAEKAVENWQKSLSNTLERLDVVTSRYHAQSDAIVAEGNTAEQRAALLADIKSLQLEKLRLQGKLEEDGQALHEAEAFLHYRLEESPYE